MADINVITQDILLLRDSGSNILDSRIIGRTDGLFLRDAGSATVIGPSKDYRFHPVVGVQSAMVVRATVVGNRAGQL